MAKSIIEVQNLIKRYKNSPKNAVDDITFEVKEGEFFCFLGPNGAGKTTTISILTTTLSKTSGKITVAGYDLDRDSSNVRQNVGIIFQNPSLDLNLTAEENIRLHSTLYGLYPFRPTFSTMPESYQKRVHDLSQILGLGNDVFKPIRTFSGGMKRKLEIMRSLIHKPKVLFLDEPTIGLDPLSRKSLWEYLTEVRKIQKTTIFLTTHYLEEAEESDRVCIINHGKIITIGTPQKIKSELVEEYLLLDAKNKSNLKKELQDLNLKFEDGSPIKVLLKKDTYIQKIIQNIKTPLSLIETHSPSLEEAYLEIIGANKLNGEKE